MLHRPFLNRSDWCKPIFRDVKLASYQVTCPTTIKINKITILNDNFQPLQFQNFTHSPPVSKLHQIMRVKCQLYSADQSASTFNKCNSNKFQEEAIKWSRWGIKRMDERITSNKILHITSKSLTISIPTWWIMMLTSLKILGSIIVNDVVSIGKTNINIPLGIWRIHV